MPVAPAITTRLLSAIRFLIFPYLPLCSNPGQIEQKNSPAEKPANAPLSSSTQYCAAAHRLISATQSRNGSAPTSNRAGHPSARYASSHCVMNDERPPTTDDRRPTT